MSHKNRRQIRRQLETEIRGRPGRERLLTLQTEFPALRGFADWPTVFRRLLDRSVSDKTKDEILQALIWTLQREQTTELNTVLLLVFWPALLTIARKCWRWDPDPDELWHNLEWGLLETIHGLDVLSDPTNVAKRIFRATLEGLRRQYRREWRYERREAVLTDARSPRALEPHLDKETAVCRRRDRVSRALRALERALRSGHLSEDEFHVVLEVDYLGVPLDEFARSKQLSYEAAKKRHQRALASARKICREK